ncbi:hypothetical protein F4Z99_03380 [Candidatus Poribacteria bacterium]|nr:hypothetical protein [Candidatus Poribacteria bacterium]
MNLERLERQWQGLSDARSKFAAALKAAQTNLGQDLSESDIRYIRLIAEIKRNLSDVRRSVCGMRKKIKQLKSFEGIL